MAGGAGVRRWRFSQLPGHPGAPGAAATGLIYLFRFQLEPLLHADLMKVDPPSGVVQQPYAASALLAAGGPVGVDDPSRPAAGSSVFATTLPDGSPREST